MSHLVFVALMEYANLSVSEEISSSTESINMYKVQVYTKTAIHFGFSG